MIIHPPRIQIEGEEVSFSAQVEFEQSVPDVPEELWFKFPVEYEDHLSGTSECFAAALLLTCMYWGEDIHIRGPVSPRFAYGFEEYMQVFHIWKPNPFKLIKIDYENIALPQTSKRQKFNLAAFSGGVDSTFTLRTNLQDRPAGDPFRITHGYFLQGIDYALDETRAYRSALEKYTRFFADLGLPLFPARSNAAEFSRYRISQTWSYGGIIIGTALALGGGFGRFFFPAGHPYDYLVPVGSLPVVDHLLSTDEMDIIHHGAGFHRQQKLEHIVDWEPVRYTLRVCVRKPKLMDGLNCSACSKCWQNMIRLDMMGKLPEFTTFTRPFTRLIFLRWATNNSFFFITIREMMKLARRHGRWDYILGLLFIWVGGNIRRWILKLVQKVLGRERMYEFKRSYYRRVRKPE